MGEISHGKEHGLKNRLTKKTVFLTKMVTGFLSTDAKKIVDCDYRTTLLLLTRPTDTESSKSKHADDCC